MTQEVKELTQEKIAPKESDHRVVQFPVDIYTGKDAYHLEASIPGATQESIDVTINHENHLVIQASVKNEETPGLKPVYKEFAKYDYKRTFHIDEKINTGQIEAGYKDGILNVTLPLTEPVTRKIEIKTES
ncbi:MAG: Hsp20/alpha crystallin family protein [Leptospirales bacterium]